LDKLTLLIRDKQAELQALQAELTEALTGIESPDYEWAARIQPLIYGLEAEIDRLYQFREVADPPQNFATVLSRLLTDDTVTTLELWVTIKDYWNDVTVRLLEIRKAKSGYRITCTLRLSEPAQMHLHHDYTTAKLRHLGWTAAKGGKTCWFKAQVKSPDQFDRFNQRMAVTMLEVLRPLWGHGQQYFRYR